MRTLPVLLVGAIIMISLLCVTSTPLALEDQGVLNEHLLVLSTTEEGTAAIVVVWSPDRGLGTDSRTSVFPFADGARVSEVCTSTERSSKCRDLVVIKSGTHGYIIQVLLHSAVGLMELQYNGQELLHVQNRSLRLQRSYENNTYIPVDISLNDDGTTVVFYLNSDAFCFGYIDVPDIANAMIHSRMCDTRISFDYQYISNFVFFPPGIDEQYFFIHSGVLYSIQLQRGTGLSPRISIDGSCNRLAYSGDHAFFAYCNSEQTSLTYDTDVDMILPTNGLPYVCSGASRSTFQVYLNSTDQSTVVQHDQQNFTTSGENFTFGVCYDDDTFFLVNDQGVVVLRPSNNSFSTISSGSSSMVVFDGPYLAAQDDDPPRVTLYNMSLQSIVEWNGLAMAVGVITDLKVVPSSTSLAAPASSTSLAASVSASTSPTSSPMLVPSTSTPPLLPTPTTPTPTPTVPSPTNKTLKKGELAGIVAAAVVVFVVLISIAIIIRIFRRSRKSGEADITLKRLDSPPTPDLSDPDHETSDQDLPPSPPASDQDLPLCPPTSDRGLPLCPPASDQDLPPSPPASDQDLTPSPPASDQDLPPSPPTSDQGLPLCPPASDQDLPPSPPASDQGLSSSASPASSNPAPIMCTPVPISDERCGQMVNGCTLEPATKFNSDQVTRTYNKRTSSENLINDLQTKCTQSQFNH